VDRIRKTDPKSDSFALKLSDGVTYYLNPGSVGQPRDGDARAAYVLYEPEGRVVNFVRCPYDYARTQMKIREAGLPDILADRLASGR
jgi:diadenosine tetraphosphatase ApaH/serine/threonine PP2A family protein phosphatase